ncbi:hypothetical protein G7Y89_g1148 [Cudoniella acicularis]|uniref:Uncharacterized protein n=1 Tax=Cudoniella acicularis TaxID=354080 RepID=A0A8H4RVT9_9HELO|nr:hypothetical protein G7Y89_g1148 [Cudoniella acicularis]
MSPHANAAHVLPRDGHTEETSGLKGEKEAAAGKKQGLSTGCTAEWTTGQRCKVCLPACPAAGLALIDWSDVRLWAASSAAGMQEPTIGASPQAAKMRAVQGRAGPASNQPMRAASHGPIHSNYSNHSALGRFLPTRTRSAWQLPYKELRPPDYLLSSFLTHTLSLSITTSTFSHLHSFNPTSSTSILHLQL